MALNLSPPRVMKNRTNHPTRWEKEKAAAGDPNAYDYPDDPKLIGPWIIGETVGKGASGRVKLARHKLTGKLAAVKILPAGIISRSRNSLVKAEKHRMGIEREIVMMKLMEHPNIMRLYDVWEGERELFLVLEWIEGGELFDLIVNRGRLPPLEALAYFKQIIHGLSYCHAFSIAHRDLKPENILIHGSKNELIKIADWGMAAFQSPLAQLETSCGSPHYASPEIIRGEPYEGTKADIWSVGIVLFALIAGKLPFDDKHVPSLLGKVKSGKFDMPSYVYPEAADLIKRMLIVDVAKRISMSEILAHPFFSRDTPGIYYIPPPSVSALHAPLASADDIDQDVLSSLRIIFGKHATRAFITNELLQDAPNAAKAFYVLLIKFRDRQMENFNGDRDDAEGKTGPHPYQSPRIQPIDHLSVASAMSSPSSLPSHSTARPSHNRTQSSPTKHHSVPAGMRPRLSTISGPRPPRIPLPSVPVPSYATATGSESVRESSKLAPPSTPPIPATPAPPYQPNVPAPRPSRRRDTSPIIAGLGLGISAPATKLAIGVSIRSNRRRRDTSPSAPGPPISAVSNASKLESTSPASQSAAIDVKAKPRSPGPRMRRATSPAPLLPPVSLASQSPEVPQAPASPCVPITAPRARNSETQRAMDVLTSQLNVLVEKDNAERKLLQSPLELQEANKPAENSGEQRVSSLYRKSSQPQERAGSLPITKEKGTANSPQRGRSGSDAVRRTPGTSKGAFAYGFSDQARERTGYLPSTEEEKENEGTRNTKRNRSGSEGTKIAQIGFKRGMSRKNRPTALDLDDPSSTMHRPTFNVTSPTSTPATPLLTPVVGEFRGWFSNLFNWKTPTYVLHSHNNFLTTRDETARLLTEFGVSVLLDDVQGWGVLRCKTDEIIDANGVAIQKQVRFRVEFAPFRTLPLTSPTLDGPSRVPPLAPPQTNVPLSCTLTLIQEKGALSTFRTVYHRLRMEWRLDTLHSPAVGSMFPMYSGRPGAAIESGTGVMHSR